MHPVLFKIGPVSFYSYGAMVALGFLIGLRVACVNAEKNSFTKQQIIDLALYVLISGIIGARILFVILNMKYFLKNPLEIFMITQGGLTILGAIPFATIVGILYAKKKNLPVLKLADFIIVYVALGQAIGRIGCFLNGCCYGKPTSSFFGVRFPGYSEVVHPTQIYSALAMFILFLILRFIRDRKTYDGQVFISYGLFYCVFRIFVEFLRSDSSAVLLGLNVFQIISIALFIICLYLGVAFKKKARIYEKL